MAGRLMIEWVPLDAAGIDDRAIAATWASLSVKAVEDGRTVNLTRVLDRHARTERHEVYGTVLPLAEWIARCWHALFSAKLARPSHLAGRSLRMAWQKTHCWRSCSEGTAVPDLEFVRLDDDLFECRWSNSPGDDADEFERVLFLTRGVMKVNADDLRQTLGEFVDSVLARLRAQAPTDPRADELQATWKTARDSKDHEFTAGRFAARLGLHWWALPAPRRAELLRNEQRVVNPIAEAGLEASLSAGFDAWIEECDRLWQRCAGAPKAHGQWTVLREGLARHASAANAVRPWDRGWTAARLLRDHMRQPHDQPWEAREVHDRIGREEVDGANGSTRSIIGWVAGRSPLIARRVLQHRDGLRFAQARDLFPLLFRGRVDRDFGCVLSDRIAGTLPVANAFAAELLAPVERVRHEVRGRDRLGNEELLEIALDLDAPAQCVRHQVENHDLAEVV